VLVPFSVTTSTRPVGEKPICAGPTASPLSGRLDPGIGCSEPSWPSQSALMLFGALLAVPMAGIPAAMCEMFPHGVRVSAVSVGYGLAYAIFGGTAPAVALWLIRRSGSETAFVWYLMALMALTFVVALGLRERSGRPLD